MDNSKYLLITPEVFDYLCKNLEIFGKPTRECRNVSHELYAGEYIQVSRTGSWCTKKVKPDSEICDLEEFKSWFENK